MLAFISHLAREFAEPMQVHMCAYSYACVLHTRNICVYVHTVWMKKNQLVCLTYKKSSLSPCVAVCCSVLQCVAVCCSVLQYGTACCSMVQRGAVWGSVGQLGAAWCRGAL